MAIGDSGGFKPLHGPGLATAGEMMTRGVRSCLSRGLASWDVAAMPLQGFRLGAGVVSHAVDVRRPLAAAVAPSSLVSRSGRVLWADWSSALA